MVNKNFTLSNQYFLFSDDDHTDDFVLIKSTGEVAKIRNKYYSSDNFFIFSDRTFKINYLLTNGQSHQEQDLVVGLSNIRNYKLQNFIEDGI
jgi:hypothetical protein